MSNRALPTVALHLAVLFLAFPASATQSPTPATQSPAQPLWSSVHGGPVQLVEPELRAQRIVLADPAFLEAHSEGTFELELFDGERIAVDLEVRERPGQGRTVWYGELGLPGSGDHLMFATTQGSAAATLWIGDRLLRVRGSVDGMVLAEVNADGFEPCMTGRPHEVAAAGGAPQRGPGELPPGAIGLGTYQIADVLTMYTDGARAVVGNTAAMLALIDLAIAETNLSLENCDAGLRVRLVHSAETNYNESGSMNTDLSRLRDTNDNHMDEAHVLRDQYGADHVTLLTESGGGCGIAYIMTNVSNNFETWAFSVTKYSCATGNYTYGHEFGHNYGCAHDPGNAGNASHNYAYGYRTPGEEYRSVMAYSPGSRKPIFSSPLHSWAGLVMGVHNAQDNARAITQNASTIAGWRSTVVPFEDWTTYCIASPNSVGSGAFVYADGTTSVAVNDFNIGAVGAVPNQFGLFYYGSNQALVPFGDGIRCVGGSTFRLGPPQLTDNFGEQLRPIDLTAPPASSGPGALSSGSTWNFQLWYRDPFGLGSGFNLSDGISATFYP